MEVTGPSEKQGEMERGGVISQATDVTCAHKIQPIPFDKMKLQKRSVSQFSNEGFIQKM